MKKAQTGSAGSLVEVLLRDGLITKAQLEEAVRIQHTTEKPLARILVEMGAITESAKMSILKKTFGYEMVSLAVENLSSDTLNLIPRSIAYRHHVVPVRTVDDTLILAMEDPSNLVLIDNLKALINMNIKPVIASGIDIDEALTHYPPEIAPAPRGMRISFLKKLIRALFLPIMGFVAPVLIFLGILWSSENLQVRLAPLTAFDFILYFILGLGLWALIAWEINGLIFKREKKE